MDPRRVTHPSTGMTAVATPGGDIQLIDSKGEGFSVVLRTTIDDFDDKVGHTGPVYAVAFNSDGTYLATGSETAEVMLWDVANWKFIRTFTGHTDLVSSVAFTEDGTKLATACEDRTAKLWNVSNGDCIQTLTDHSGKLLGVAFNNDSTLLATASTDHTAKLWSVADGQCIRTLTGHTDQVWSVAFNSTHLATASEDKTVKLWDVSNGECVRTLTEHIGSVFCVHFNQDGTHLATASRDKTVKLWDASSGECIRTMTGHDGLVSAVAFNKDGTQLASGGSDSTVKLWSVADGSCIRTIDGAHTQSLAALAYNHDGTRLATGEYDDAAVMWDVSNGECLQTTPRHALMVRLSDHAARLAICEGNIVKLWNTFNGECLHTLDGHINDVTSIAFNHDGTHLATASYDRTVKLWDAFSGECLHTLDGHTDTVWFLRFNGDGTHIMTVCDDSIVNLWDVSRGECLCTITDDDFFNFVDFNHDGTHLATVSKDHTAKLWNASNGECLHTFTGAVALSFSPICPHLAIGSANTVKLWDVSSGECIHTLDGHTDSTRLLRYSRDGTRLATASEDHTVKLWDVSSGECLRTVDDHTDSVWFLDFNDDGTHLVIADKDFCVTICNLSTGECVHTMCGDDLHCSRSRLVLAADDRQVVEVWDIIDGLTLHRITTSEDSTADVTSLAFNEDGNRLLTATSDNTVHLWDVSSGECLATLPMHNVESIAFCSNDRCTVVLRLKGSSECIRWTPQFSSQEAYDGASELLSAQRRLSNLSTKVSSTQKDICSSVRSRCPNDQDPSPEDVGDDPEVRIHRLCEDRNRDVTSLLDAVRKLDEIRTDLVATIATAFKLPLCNSVDAVECLFRRRLPETNEVYAEYEELLGQRHEKEDAQDELTTRLNALKRRIERQGRLNTKESAELRRLEADKAAIAGQLRDLQNQVAEAQREAVQSARELQQWFPEMLLRVPVEDDVPIGAPAEGDVIYRNGSVTVYKAKVNGVTRCIKRQGIPSDEKGRMRLRREVDVLRELRGPGVLPLLYSKEHGDYHYIVTVYYELGCLSDFFLNTNFSEGRPQIDNFVARKSMELLSGLHRIHSSEVVHGDLKPSNIFVSAAEEFVVGDFGIAKTTDATTTKSMTVDYAPPEYVTTGFRSTTAGDIFSLGLVLEDLGVRCLGESVWVTGGERPFDGLTAAPPLPLQGHPNLKHEWFKHLLGVMLQRDPTQRWTVVELLTHQFLAPGEDGERGRNFTDAVRVLIQHKDDVLEVDRRPQQEGTGSSFLFQSSAIPVDAPLRVFFVRESGEDATGLTKVLYSHLLRDLVNSGLLVTGGAVWHVACDCDVETVVGGFQSLELLGVLLMRFALAYASPKFPAFQCPIVLSRYLLRFLLVSPPESEAPLCPTASEIAEFDRDSASRYVDVRKHPAHARQYDLALNDGSMVTAVNVSRFVEERRRDTMHDSRRKSLHAVRAGFQRNPELLAAVREWVGGAEQQLQIKLCIDRITSEDVVRVLHFRKMSTDSQIATLLKEYLRRCDKPSLLQFLYFVTGGYALAPIRVFLCQHEPSTVWPLPSVSTCFNHLKVCDYPDLETLTERLHYAMAVSVTMED